MVLSTPKGIRVDISLFFPILTRNHILIMSIENGLKWIKSAGIVGGPMDFHTMRTLAGAPGSGSSYAGGAKPAPKPAPAPNATPAPKPAPAPEAGPGPEDKSREDAQRLYEEGVRKRQQEADMAYRTDTGAPPTFDNAGNPGMPETVETSVSAPVYIPKPPIQPSVTPGEIAPVDAAIGGTGAESGEDMSLDNGGLPGVTDIGPSQPNNDYSRIFGKNFNPGSSSKMDTWLKGQADRLRGEGYSDEQISTMLGNPTDSWKRYGRKGQDYVVNTRRYTRPMGKSAAAPAVQELFDKFAGFNAAEENNSQRAALDVLWRSNI